MKSITQEVRQWYGDDMHRYRQMIARQIDDFTTKRPLIGPIFWILGIQYFVTQLVVAAAWPAGYSWRDNLISDLGVTSACGMFDERYVCSPLGWLMNLSFALFGITIAIGAVLIYTEFTRSILSRIGFSLVCMSGVGGLMVGLFPLDVQSTLHTVGAVAALLIGNIGLLFLALGLKGVRRTMKLYTFATGAICVIGFTLFSAGVYLGVGVGNMERVASYPFSLWMIVFGMYMIYVRTRKD